MRVDSETVLVICKGCDTSCPAEKMVPAAVGRRIVSIRDDKRDPAEIVQSLLSEGKP